MTKLRLLITAFLMILPALLGAPAGRAQSQSQVGIVVQFGDGSLQTACVSFTEQQISGFDALQRAGFAIEAAFDPYQGSAVCRINGEGCAADNCFCDMPAYWTYWHLSSGSWVYSGSGSSNTSLSHGNVDGWKWGQGDTPPMVGFEQICAQAPTQPPPAATTAAPTFTLPAPTDPPPAVESPTSTPTSLPTDLPPSSGVELPTATAVELLASSPTSAAPTTPVAQGAAETTSTPTPGATDPGSATPFAATATQTVELAAPENTLAPTKPPATLLSPSHTPLLHSTSQPSEPADSVDPGITVSSSGYAIFGIIAAGLGLLLLGWALRMRAQ